MSRPLNIRTAKKYKTASFNDKAFKLFDGGGLYLLVQKSGKYWRMKYHFAGKEKHLALGVYPQVSLAEARERRKQNKELLSQDIDPKVHRDTKARLQESLSTNTFKAIASEWYEIHSHNVSKDHAKRNYERLEKYVFPKLGNYPISEITTPQLLSVFRELENKGILETASRVRALCSQVFRYAITTDRVYRDPAGDLKGALKTPEEKHHPAIIEPEEIGELLRAIDGYSGHPSCCMALKLAPFLFVRPGELRKAEWKDFDLESAIWKYKPSKNGLPFDFPLSRQAVELIREQYCLTGQGRYIFPAVNNKHRPMSNNTMNVALNKLGFKDKMTPHGFRAMARTVLAEKLNFQPEYIEQQLGHSVKDPLGRAYNRTTYFEQRKKMMQAWADYLDTLKEENTNIVPLFKRA